MFAAVLITSNTIGALPLVIAYVMKAASDPEVITEIAANPNDLSILGLDPNLGLIMMLFPFVTALIAYVLLVKPLNGRTLKMTINGTGVIRWNRFFFSAFIWLIISAAYLFLCLKLDPANFSINNTSGTLITLSVISFIFIPFQAAFEEVLFRGYLMQGFVVMFRNRWIPLVLTSVLFGLMHAFNPEVKDFGFFIMMPQYVLFGLIFGIITLLDDGIEAAMGAHTANNIFLCIMVTHESSALQTPAVYLQHNVYPWTEFLALLIAGAIFVFILKIIFRWNNLSILLSEVGREKSMNQIS
jgi:hypothetical protein